MAAEWRTGFKNGLAVVELTTATSTAVVALQGAQVLSFVPRGGRDWLWVSEKARWGAGVALRGGIPICFPWFGPHPTERGLPAHGFARARPWRLTGVAQLEGGASGPTSRSTPTTRRWRSTRTSSRRGWPSLWVTS